MTKLGFDLVAFSEAAPGTGAQGIARALQDRRYTEPGGDQIRVKSAAPYLAGIFYASESSPDNVRVRQTSRFQDLQFLQACDLNDPDFSMGFTDLMETPIFLRAGEAATCLQENATDEDVIVLWMLSPGAFGKPVAPTHIIKAESDQTLTANTWTQCTTLTYDQELPDGLYHIVGMKVASYISSGFMLGGARLILDKTEWRPGVAIAQSEADKTARMSAYEGRFSKWGRQRDLIFHSKSMPQLELCSPAALTDHILELAVEALDRKNVGQFQPEGI